MDNASSIDKAIAILGLLSDPPYIYKAADLCRKSGFSRPTVYRTLAVLERNGLVIRQPESAQYRVGPGLYHMGIAYVNALSYKAVIEETLHEIAEYCKESVGIAVKEEDTIISIFEEEVHQPMKTNERPGKYCAVNKGCYGKCLMAYQDEAYLERYLEGRSFERTFPDVLTGKEELMREYRAIRERGYATSFGELGFDIWGVGVPLFRADGTIKACIAIAYYREDGDGGMEKLERMRDILFSYRHKLEAYFPDW